MCSHRLTFFRCWFRLCVGEHCMQTREALLGLLLVRPACCLSHSLWSAHAPGRVARLSAARVSNLRSCRATASAAMSASQAPASIQWFRKGLRLHDNRALLEACDGAGSLYPLFVLDSDPRSPEARAGSLRYVSQQAHDCPAGYSEGCCAGSVPRRHWGCLVGEGGLCAPRLVTGMECENHESVLETYNM